MNSNLVHQTLLGQFRVDGFVASGGMGVVFRVWDLKRSVHLAMKVLHADLQEEPSILKRFQREARALQKLAHPNIVPFYGLHQAQEFVFLLERFIDGPSLKQLIRHRDGQPLPVLEALTYLKALSAALGYAHAHGVVHCDVKPGNVMLDQGGNIYLTDFGIARHAESTTTTLGMSGSPAYMAPEQLLGKPVTPATDVYALGVLLFELLTGQRPFRATPDDRLPMDSPGANRPHDDRLHAPAPDAHKLNPEIPPALSEVIHKALAKDPERRYPDVQALFSAACRAAGIDQGAVPDRAHAPQDSAPQMSLQDTSLSDRARPHVAERRSYTKRTLFTGLTMAVLAAVSLFTFFVLRPTALPPTPPSTQPLTTPIATQSTPAPPAEKPPTEGAHFTPTSTPTSAPTATPLPSLITPFSIIASSFSDPSQDAGGNPTTYYPENVSDGNPVTAWRTPGDGRGEWLILHFDRPVIVTSIGVIPGYAKVDPYDNTHRFTQNHVVRTVLVEFSDGTQATHSFEYSEEWQFVALDPVKTSFVRIVIQDTYPPRSDDPRDYTPISEIQIYGWLQ